MGNSADPSPTLDDSAAVAVTGKVMVAAIIVLFLVVVFVFFLHLYAKWFWGRRADGTLPSHNGRRRFVFAPSQDPVFALRRGLEPSLIRSLPVLIFHPEEFKEGLECAVCLCELSEGEKARLLPKCNHGFHVDCIDMWFQSHSTCPLCRNSVAPDSPNSDSDIESPVDDSSRGNSIESPNFPTNVLFWGNQTQVSTRGSGLEEGYSPSHRSSSLVIEIPQELTEGSSSLSPSSVRFAEEEMKSPMATRLRSLKRLLSRDKRVDPYSPSSVDVEYGEVMRGQSSKTTSDS